MIYQRFRLNVKSLMITLACPGSGCSLAPSCMISD